MLLRDISFLIGLEDELVHGKVEPAYSVLSFSRRFGS
jgi:hypothetical protein